MQRCTVERFRQINNCDGVRGTLLRTDTAADASVFDNLRFLVLAFVHALLARAVDRAYFSAQKAAAAGLVALFSFDDGDATHRGESVLLV